MCKSFFQMAANVSPSDNPPFFKTQTNINRFKRTTKKLANILSKNMLMLNWLNLIMRTTVTIERLKMRGALAVI